MATNVFPLASCRAVIVTPGSTPPDESFTVPVKVASCAYVATGTASSTRITISGLTTRQLIETSSTRKEFRSGQPEHEHGTWKVRGGYIVVTKKQTRSSGSSEFEVRGFEGSWP